MSVNTTIPPLTDAELRAAAVPVSGTVTINAIPAGTNNIGDVDVLSLPAIPTGSNVIGAVTQSGTWNVGAITTLPALVAGTANIGDVDVLTLPALVAGTALIGKVGIDQTTPGTTNAVSVTNASIAITAASLPTHAVTQSGTWNIGTVTTMPTTAVTGTFWQATQPISGTVTINAIPAGTNNIGDVDVLTLPALVAGTALIGKVGIDQTTPGTTNAIDLNGRAATTNPTAVADAAVVRGMMDKMGRQVVIQGHVRNLVASQATTITSSTTATTIIAAGGANVFTDITSLTVTNGSATATIVTLTDGTVSHIFNVPGGGGFAIPYNPPLPGTTANTTWTLQCGTSVASIYVSAVYVKNL